jgi:hypothetical protein
MEFKELEQLDSWFDEIGNQVVSRSQASIKKTAEDYLLEKKKNLHGDVYVNNIERSYVYVQEAAFGMRQIIARSLHDGYYVEYDPNTWHFFTTAICTYFGELNKDQYLKYMRNTKKEPREVTDKQLEQIRSRFRFNPVRTDVHLVEYKTLREMRLSRDMSKYIHDLEFGCVYGQGKILTGECYLLVLCQNEQFCGAAKNFPIQSVLDVVNMGIRFNTGIYLGFLT